jgi:hypothetical protein
MSNNPQSLWPGLPLTMAAVVPAAWVLAIAWAGACKLLWGAPFMASLFR